MKIVSVCGAQGEGKTTVLERLRQLGFEVVERKTSRSILAELGMTLEQVNEHPPLTRYFQDLVIDRHSSIFLKQAEMSEYGCDDSQIVFIERSFADIFTYALMALGSFNGYNSYMNSYYQKCSSLQKKFHRVISLRGRVASGLVAAEADGVRSTNPHFIRIIDQTINFYCEDMADNHVIVDTPDLDKRVDLIMRAVGL